MESKIFALRTTANREDQVADFLSTNIEKKNLAVYSVIRAHGMRGYIFVEADTRRDAEEAAFRVPYARGILPGEIEFKEIEHMLEHNKKIKMTIRKNDIIEIISGPFKRENAKITRVDKEKEEVVIELLEAAVPIPITLSIDSVKVIRREGGDVPERPEDDEPEVPKKSEPLVPEEKKDESADESDKKDEKEDGKLVVKPEDDGSYGGPLANKK